MRDRIKIYANRKKRDTMVKKGWQESAKFWGILEVVVMRSFLQFLKNEMVLTLATILAILSAFLIPPDAEYVGYVDFRTLGLLFCLMAVMGGFQRLGFFRKIAQGMLRKVGTESTRVILVLVFLAFFFSMLITNDVGLITFVPFTFTVLELLGEDVRDRLVIPVVALETLGANLGSMMTPIGNPQNLYLYGKAGLSLGGFLLLMLPLTALSGIMLMIWAVMVGKRRGAKGKLADKSDEGKPQKQSITEEGMLRQNTVVGENVKENLDSAFAQKEAENSGVTGKKKTFLLSLYGALFLLSLLTVAKVLPFEVTLGITLACVGIFDRKTLKKVDYFLLLTFIAFFVFIGNMGRVPIFANFLAGIVDGREVPVAILSSQVISNVPAALLLSGFSQNDKALIVGVNLGGMGTLIASMASLISYKYVARLVPDQKGKYLGYFTVTGLCFLAVLLMGYYGMKLLGVY